VRIHGHTLERRWNWIQRTVGSRTRLAENVQHVMQMPVRIAHNHHRRLRPLRVRLHHDPHQRACFTALIVRSATAASLVMTHGALHQLRSHLHGDPLP
jgi:hypothetical protein